MESIELYLKQKREKQQEEYEKSKSEKDLLKKTNEIDRNKLLFLDTINSVDGFISIVFDIFREMEFEKKINEQNNKLKFTNPNYIYPLIQNLSTKFNIPFNVNQETYYQDFVYLGYYSAIHSLLDLYNDMKNKHRRNAFTFPSSASSFSSIDSVKKAQEASISFKSLNKL